ncbi:RND transporter [Pseudonocardia sp. WMMC193]|uniref:RND transporter n=1 Tax=Pseudonocardia sp. WMMC193 TaxID=2911965 RepID=UPI001F1DD821|nr:RND transporter [Pseudonocardia sp. WMMC193]MCF7550724.1 RND transporter [Pseudonocardia sp. WMMC193]
MTDRQRAATTPRPPGRVRKALRAATTAVRSRRRALGWKAVGGGVLLVALAAVVVGGLLRLHIDAGTDSFVAPDDPSALALQEVGSAFGGDPVVVLLEQDQPRALLSSATLPKLLDLEGRLARLPDVAATYGPATVLNQVAGRSQDLLAELSGYRDGLASAAAQRAQQAGADAAGVAAAARAATDDFDRRYGPLLVQGLPTGLPTLRNDRFVGNVVFDEAGDPRPQWRFVVPGPGSAAVLVRPRQDLDQAGLEQLVAHVREQVDASDLGPDTRATVSGVPAIAAALGDRVRTEVPLLGAVALAAVGACYLAVRWTGRRERLLPLAATGIGTAVTLAGFGWAGQPLSLGVIAFLPVLIGVGSDFTTYLTRRASRRLVVVVGAATAASFASLATSPVPTVRDLGITLGIGILVAVGSGLVLARRAGSPEPPQATAVPGGRGVPLRTRLVAGAAAVLLAGAGWALLPSLELHADLQGFAGGLSALDDAEHVENVLGSGGEFTIAVSGGGVATPEVMSWMTEAQNAVVAAEGDRIRPVVSPPSMMSFLGAAPTAEQVDAALRLLPPYLTGSVVNSDRSLAVMTFGTRLSDAEELRDLRDSVLATLPPPPPGTSVELTGLPMVAVSAYEDVSADRYLANILGIVVAAAVLALGLRRRVDAVWAGASAAVATGVGLLLLWLTGTGLTPVTVALGSLTAAVGCEFTVLLLDAARRGDRGLRRAVLLAAAACATGYAVLTLSQLTVVAQFGLLLALSVAVALGAALLTEWLARTLGPARALDDEKREPDLVGVH